MNKICSKCKTEKSISLFYKNRVMKDGYDGYCKTCRNVQKKASTPENYQKEYNKRYYIENSGKIKETVKKYRLNNPEICRERCKAYAFKNQDRINSNKRQYFQENKERINAYRRKRKEIDPVFLISSRLRGRFNIALKRQGTHKKNKTMTYIGCTKEELRNHIQSKFVDGMSWGNKGEWHIDHIIPISSFDLSDEKQVFQAMNFTNLQPLWAIDNIRKSNKINIYA